MSWIGLIWSGRIVNGLNWSWQDWIWLNKINTLWHSPVINICQINKTKWVSACCPLLSTVWILFLFLGFVLITFGSLKLQSDEGIDWFRTLNWSTRYWTLVWNLKINFTLSNRRLAESRWWCCCWCRVTRESNVVSNGLNSLWHHRCPSQDHPLLPGCPLKVHRLRTEQMIKERLFFQSVSNKCCFDKNSSGQESQLSSPWTKKSSVTSSSMTPPPQLHLLPLFHYLPLWSLILVSAAAPHSLPSL